MIQENLCNFQQGSAQTLDTLQALLLQVRFSRKLMPQANQAGRLSSLLTSRQPRVSQTGCAPDKLQVNTMTQVVTRGSLQCALPLQSCCEVHSLQLGMFQSRAQDPADCSV